MEQGAVDFPIGEELDVSRNAIAGKVYGLLPKRQSPISAKSAPKKPAPVAEVAEQIDTSELPLKLALRRIDWSRSKCSWPDGDEDNSLLVLRQGCRARQAYCNERY